MAVDVIFELGLCHVIADERAEGTHPVALLVLLQLLQCDAREAHVAATTHHALGTGK